MAYYNEAQEQPQGHPYPAPIVYYPGPTINYQQPAIKHFGKHYARKTSFGLGITQIVLACASIAAGIMAYEYAAEYYNIGIGMWAGTWYFIAGSRAIAAGSKEPTNGQITSTLIVSVFGLLLGITELIMAAIGLAEDLYCNEHAYNVHNCFYSFEGAIAANSMMVAVGSLEIICGIWITVISARAIHAGSKEQLDTIPVTYTPQQRETIFIGLQAPSAHQPQPPPYYAQPQYPSTSNQQQQMMCAGVQQQYPSTSNQQQQMMCAGVHEAPLPTVKS